MPDNIKLNKDSIIYNGNDGLLLDGKTWKINRDGTTTLTLSKYVPNTGNTTVDTFSLERNGITLQSNINDFNIIGDDNIYVKSYSCIYNSTAELYNYVATSFNVYGGYINDEEPPLLLTVSGEKFEVNNTTDIFLNADGISLYGAGGISLWGCNSNISIDDLNSEYAMYIYGAGNTVIFGNSGKLEFTANEQGNEGTVELASNYDIILNAAENQKVYYVHDNAEPTANNEIATIGTVSSGYIPNAGNTESNTDFTLSRKSMLFRGGSFAFGLPNADPYITFNPGSFNLSSQGEVNISSTGQTTINGGISLRLVGSSNIQLATSLNNPTQYIQLSGGKFEVKTSSGSLYLNDHFTYEGNYASSQKLKLDITDTFSYSDILTSTNTTNYAFHIGSSTLQFNSTKYNLQLTPVSFIVETLNYPKASINIGSSVFVVNSYNSTTNYGSLTFSNNGFYISYGKEQNEEFIIDYKLDVHKSAFVYTGEGYLNVNSSGFNINNIITALAGDIIIDIPTDKKAYYIHNNSEPTANDEIATINSINSAVSGYIPNAGNSTNGNLTIERTNAINISSDSNINIMSSASGSLSTIHTVTAYEYAYNTIDKFIYEKTGQHLSTSFKNFWNLDNIPYCRLYYSEDINNTINVWFTPSSTDYMYDFTVRTLSNVEVYYSGSGYEWHWNSNGIDERTDRCPTAALLGVEFIFGNTQYPAERIAWNNNDIVLHADSNGKSYYVKGADDIVPTANDEIATKGDIVTPDMSNYVLKTDFNDLLEKYNDLCERLNQFLLTTGEIEPDLPTLTDKFITVPTDNVSFSFDYIDGSYTIDWGDGVVETITTAGTISHNYSESKVWEITLGPTDDESYGSLETYDFDENTGTNSNQFTEVNLNKLEYPLNFYNDYEEEANNETITTYRINYPKYHQGCGLAELLINCTALTNVYFGPLTEGIILGPIIGCDNLTTIYLDIDPEIFYISYFLAYDNFTEVYCYSETPFDLQWEKVEGEPPVQSYFRSKDYEAVEESVGTFDVSDLTIYVPANAVETYKSANGWSLYADCIVGY